jgi:hypothetical protein
VICAIYINKGEGKEIDGGGNFGYDFPGRPI